MKCKQKRIGGKQMTFSIITVGNPSRPYFILSLSNSVRENSPFEDNKETERDFYLCSRNYESEFHFDLYKEFFHSYEELREHLSWD